jgi:hypothetical protein
MSVAHGDTKWEVARHFTSNHEVSRSVNYKIAGPGFTIGNLLPPDLLIPKPSLPEFILETAIRYD